LTVVGELSIHWTELSSFLALVLGSGVTTALLTLFVSAIKDRRMDDDKRYYTAVRIAITLEDYGKLLDRLVKNYPIGYPLKEKTERRVYPAFDGYESDLDWRLIRREVLDDVMRFPGTAAHRLAVRSWYDQPWMFTNYEVPAD
jgi:hypothetical protein